MRYVFGDCTLDTTRYVLHRAGQPVRLRPKVFHVLVYLLAQRDRVVSKQELSDQVWPSQFISDATLESTVRGVRQALGDSRPGHRYLQTLRGYGYRFMAPVEERPEPLPRATSDAHLPVLDVPMDSHRDHPQTAGVVPSQAAVEGQTADASLPASETPPLPLAPLADAGERKLVTVLCCALHPTPGPRQPGTLDTLYHHIQALYTVVEHEAQRYGGTVQPVMGERLLVVFGLPAAQEDHAQRAVLAALDLQQRLHQTPLGGGAPTPRPSVGMSVHTGPVAVGSLSRDAAAARGVVGETVTHAVALQDAATPGGILCSEATARLVQGVVRLTATTPTAWPSLSAPVYQILGRRPRGTPLGRYAGRPLSPFVGRQQELATLQAILAQVEAGQGHAVGIVGEPGMGKSRLVYEVRRTLRGKQLTYLAGGGFAYGQHTPYLPMLILLRTYWGITVTDCPAIRAAKVHQRLTEVGMVPEDWAPYLLRLFEVPTASDALTSLRPEVARTRTIEALVQLALHGARQQPLVLEVENLHWLDPSSEAVLAALAERLTGVALLLLTTYRPGYRPPWLDKSYASQIALSPLTAADSHRVLRAVAQATSLPAPLTQEIVTKAGGNPFFLEELTRAVVEQEAQQAPLCLPDTVQGVVAARLDRLPPGVKRLVQTAAVIGREGPLALLHMVTGFPVDALHSHLCHLHAAELLYETALGTEPRYAFKHALTQEVAYQSLLRPVCQQLHGHIAQVLVDRFPAITETQPERVAQHYTEAGCVEQAIPYWQRAGQQALQRSANPEAVAHLTTAVALLATLPETPARAQQELDLRLALGPALMATKGQAALEVEQTYARAQALCTQVGETPEIFPTLRGLCRFYQSRGPLPTARELGEQLSRLAQRATAPTPRLEAYDALGTTLFLLGEYPTAHMHLEQGIACTHPAAQRALVLRHGVAPGVRCLGLAANTLWCLGYPAQARQRSHDTLAQAQALAHPQSLAYAQHNVATLYYRLRETPTIQALAAALLTLATAHGLPLWVGHGTLWQGWALAMQGQGAVGLAQIHQGLTAVLATGQRSSRPYQLVLLAEAAGHVGQITEGLHWLAEALMAFAVSGRGDMLSEAQRLRGELLLRQAPPDTAQAEACFQQALAIARRQQAKAWELRAAMSLSRLCQQQGKCQEAHDLLAPIYGWFTEGFDTADLQEAKVLLEELT